MIETFSDKERIFALLAFTKELIIQSKTSELIELERKLTISREIENRKKLAIQKRKFGRNQLNPGGRRPFLNSPVKNSGFSKSISSEPSKNISSGFMPSISSPSQVKRGPSGPMQRIRVPDVMLPNRFGYLRPVPTNEELDLGKLNQLINDGRVREIECDGPDTEVIARGTSNPRTNIFLSNEEIQSIFLAFSRAAKIPIEEDIVKIAAGGFILNGVNSNVVGSRFVIKRILNSFSR